MVRSDRRMPDGETRQFLRERAVAHVGTTDASGWPYVVALMYVYEEGNLLYLHRTAPGTLLCEHPPESRICIHVDEPGSLQRGQPSPCNSALVYESAVAHGEIRVVEETGANEKKAWFFDRLLERLKEPMSAYQRPGYPLLDQIILFEVAFEIVTGKLSVGLHH